MKIKYTHVHNCGNAVEDPKNVLVDLIPTLEEITINMFRVRTCPWARGDLESELGYLVNKPKVGNTKTRIRADPRVTYHIGTLGGSTVYVLKRDTFYVFTPGPKLRA